MPARVKKPVRKVKAAAKVKARSKKKVAKPAAAALSSKELVARLAEVARIGALFIEGEDVINALQPECRQWKLADDINFNAAVAVPLKKTLLRIEMIEKFPYYAIVWRRRPDDPKLAEPILAGRMNSPYNLGKNQCVPIFPALRQALDRGRPASAAIKDTEFEKSSVYRYGHAWLVCHDSLLRAGKAARVISYFHPILDSRDEVVAALELACVGRDT